MLVKQSTMVDEKITFYKSPSIGLLIYKTSLDIMYSTSVEKVLKMVNRDG